MLKINSDSGVMNRRFYGVTTLRKEVKALARMSDADMKKFCKQIPGEVSKYCEINGIKLKESTRKFGMSYETYNKRTKEPEKFQLEEVLRIASWMNRSLFSLLGKDVSP